ncbi:MAG: uroporphyrinogen-III C-methyltransferase [Granulosicoccus sp.]
MVRSKVYIIGAGPGDPDLLTVKALRLIQQADTIVYDRLVSPEILGLIPERCSLTYAGKTTDQHTLAQHEINSLLVTLARDGKMVVRLKGGDPFVFGRGGEEALALTNANLAFEIVPGITAAQACAAYAGIPLTHRGLAGSVQFITGHRKNNESLRLDTSLLADENQTLVFYMGLANAHLIARDLIAAGRQPSTLVAIIEEGTTARQRTIITSIGELPDTIVTHGVCPPAMLVIGNVVSLSSQLDWFVPLVEEMQLKHA